MINCRGTLKIERGSYEVFDVSLVLKCIECEIGYLMNDENDCVKCDDKPYTECEVCVGLDALATETECTECAAHHRL